MNNKNEYWQDKVSILVVIIGIIIISFIFIFNYNEKDSSVSRSNKTTKPLENNSNSNIFDNDSFPKSTCGDVMPSNLNEFPVDFYPVYIDNSSENLQLVQSRFCRDAFRITRKNIGKSIQVSSFRSYQRAEQFRDFLIQQVGSGEIGNPRRLESPP